MFSAAHRVARCWPWVQKGFAPGGDWWRSNPIGLHAVTGNPAPLGDAFAFLCKELQIQATQLMPCHIATGEGELEKGCPV